MQTGLGNEVVFLRYNIDVIRYIEHIIRLIYTVDTRDLPN